MRNKYAVHCNGMLNYISAVFSSKEKANDYAKSLNRKLKAKVIEVKYEKYPIYIIEEKGKDFIFTNDLKVIREKIKGIKKIKNFEGCYFTYYIIKKSFSTEKGTDQMGSLDHIHITNRYLK